MGPDTNLSELAVQRIDGDPARPTIVFLHDSLGCIALWRDFPQRLSALTHCPVLIYDRQGYGSSPAFADPKRDIAYLEHEADRLHGQLKTWNIEKAVLFGHSDGGSIALIAAGKYGAQIAGVITEGAHIFVEEETLRGIGEAMERYRTTDLKPKLQKYHGEKTEALFRAWTDTWTRDDFRKWNIGSFLPRITCPCLVIQGERDEYGTLAQVEGVVRAVTGPVSTLILPGVGHSPHREVPEIVLERATRFILDFA